MDKNRKQRLKALIDSRFEGNQQRFADCVVMSKGRISQLLDDNEPFGERAAKNILTKLNDAGINLPDGYFEAQAPSAELAAPVSTPKITLQQALAVLQAEIERQASAAATSIHHLEHAWPFKNITRDQWLDLTDEQRTAIETVAASMVSTHHSAGGGGNNDKRQAA